MIEAAAEGGGFNHARLGEIAHAVWGEGLGVVCNNVHVKKFLPWYQFGGVALYVGVTCIWGRR